MSSVRLFLFCSLFLLFRSSLSAQLYCTAANQARCETHLANLAKADLAGLPVGQVAIAVGKQFMGTPYVGKTLEVGEEEQLVIELGGLDCTTFLENVVVMTRLVKQQRLSFADFQQELTQLRYRGGQLAGYASRLHYFSDWLDDNAEKGLLRQLSAALGGVVSAREINFMSSHPSAYPQLADPAAVAAIREVERQLNQRTHKYLPKASVRSVEDQIQDGDLIAITTDIRGLDIIHVGMAIHQGGRLHLFHASTDQKRVVISQKPLHEYLASHKRQTGIMVARLETP